MRRRLIIMLVAVLTLILAACTPASAPAPAPTQPPNGFSATQATSAPQAQVTESATATNVPATAAPAATAPAITAPAATPDLEKITKAQPDDWKRGPDGAKVTIIEWGDFQ